MLNLIKWKDASGCVHKFRLVDRVSSKWESFGYRLDIPQDMLTAWWEESLGNSAKCWMKVMRHWLMGEQTSEYPTTWEGLYEMLEDVAYIEEARGLREAVLAFRASQEGQDKIK